MQKKTQLQMVLLFALVGIGLLTSCKKSSQDDTSNFTWTYQGTTFTAGSHKAYVYTMATHPIILAGKGQSVTSSTLTVGITVSAFTPGTYTVTNSGANTVYFVDDAGFDHWGTSGTVTITSYSNNRISGSFSAIIQGPGGSSQPISGSFTDTPVEP